jgi:hypothetical protein
VRQSDPGYFWQTVLNAAAALERNAQRRGRDGLHKR